MRGRAVSAAAILAFALLAGGCHRETTRAYHPPPPPATSTAANHGGRSSRPIHPENGDAAGRAVPSPAPPPNSFGKPVSTEVGLAIWYGPPYAGRKGADGTVYDQNAMTAAHLTLPLGSVVRVTHLPTNR